MIDGLKTQTCNRYHKVVVHTKQCQDTHDFSLQLRNVFIKKRPSHELQFRKTVKNIAVKGITKLGTFFDIERQCSVYIMLNNGRRLQDLSSDQYAHSGSSFGGLPQHSMCSSFNYIDIKNALHKRTVRVHIIATEVIGCYFK